LEQLFVHVFSAEGNYVRMQWGQERPLLGRSLAVLESKLDPQRFFRANRQQIINLELIRSVDLGIGGWLHVQLNDGREIQISRRQARQFRERTTV
jgi:two-component system LytT family response regulator